MCSTIGTSQLGGLSVPCYIPSQQGFWRLLLRCSRGRFLYSNLGFGLLGYLMELKTGISYEKLVFTQLLAPLNMYDTKIVLSSQAWSHDVARGYRKNGTFAERNTPCVVRARSFNVGLSVAVSLRALQLH